MNKNNQYETVASRERMRIYSLISRTSGLFLLVPIIAIAAAGNNMSQDSTSIVPNPAMSLPFSAINHSTSTKIIPLPVNGGFGGSFLQWGWGSSSPGACHTGNPQLGGACGCPSGYSPGWVGGWNYTGAELYSYVCQKP